MPSCMLLELKKGANLGKPQKKVVGSVAEGVVGSVAEVDVGSVAEVVVGSVAEGVVGSVAEVVVGSVAEVDVGSVAEVVVGSVAIILSISVLVLVGGSVGHIGISCTEIQWACFQPHIQPRQLVFRIRFILMRIRIRGFASGITDPDPVRDPGPT